MGEQETIIVYKVMRPFSFENLIVWQESRELAKQVYSVTKSFPQSELFGITNQIRRCAVSVPSNIAESTGRVHTKEKQQFLAIAYSSLIELLNQLILSTDFGFLDEGIFENEIRPKIHRISYKLNNLKKSLNREQ